MKKAPHTKPIAGPEDQRLGFLVSVARKEAGITQVRLAEQLGITFQQVQKYERGKNRISAVRLKHIADVFQMPVTFFYDGITLNTIEAAAGSSH